MIRHDELVDGSGDWGAITALPATGGARYTGHSARGPRRADRRGQALVEFAVVALVLYLILAVIIEFGRAIWTAQTVQAAAEVLARELARAPLPPLATLDSGPERQPTDVLHPGAYEEIASIYSDDFLVIDITDQDQPLSNYLDSLNVPLVNKMLAPVMLVSRVGDRTMLRFPGALVTSETAPSGFTVQVPIVTARDERGVETIAWRHVVEGIPQGGSDLFSVMSAQRGFVALRINYPFQAAAMTAFGPTPAGQTGNLNTPIVADDSAVVAPPPLDGAELVPIDANGNDYRGSYGGDYGLGELGALNSPELTGGLPVRPFRRIITGQGMARREVFGVVDP